MNRINSKIAGAVAITLLLLTLSSRTGHGQTNTGILFNDDFEDGNADGWNFVVINPYAGWSIKWFVEMDGTYVYSGEGGIQWGGGDAMVYTDALPSNDYCIRADVKIVEVRNPGSHHSIAARVQNSPSYYEFMMHGSGTARLYRVIQGQGYTVAFL